MKNIFYIESVEQFKIMISNAAVFMPSEIILGCTELSRYTKTTSAELLEILALGQKHNILCVLEWDALNMESRFQETLKFVERLPLHDFSAIRVQDPGAVEYIKEKFSWLPVQLILENGNHNLIGLSKWCDYLGAQLQRLVLSNELSKEKLSEYAAALSTPIEVLVMGRILLFYTPRKLLSPLEKTDILNQSLEAFGTSEESPHSGFPLIENSHGTFMFNVKDLYLLDHLDELSEMKIAAVRIDLRFDESTPNYYEKIAQMLGRQIPESALTIKKNHLRPMIKGFYNINKTDVLFTKLKNKRTQRQDLNYVGEIVDVERDQQLALMIKGNAFHFEKNISLKMITPEGKEKSVELSWAKSASGENIAEAVKNDLVLIPYTNGVTVKTQVYLNPKT